MPNIIANGDFERGLDGWDVSVEDPLFTTVERTGTGLSRGLSLRCFARNDVLQQTLLPESYATDSYLHFWYGGYGASFYVYVYYADGTREAAMYYGHWPETWEEAWVPVSQSQAIARIQFELGTAYDFYLDDISLEGTIPAQPSAPPGLPWTSPVKPIPEQVIDLEALMIGHFFGVQRELNRISALLSKQRYPNLRKEVEAELANRLPEGARPDKKR